jgi:hypothetical protein
VDQHLGVEIKVEPEKAQQLAKAPPRVDACLDKMEHHIPEIALENFDIIGCIQTDCKKRWQISSVIRKLLISLSQSKTRHPAVCIRTDRVHPILVDYFVFGD